MFTAFASYDLDAYVLKLQTKARKQTKYHKNYYIVSISIIITNLFSFNHLLINLLPVEEFIDQITENYFN